MILSENDLSLSLSQEKLILSGWGEKAFYKTIVKKIVYNSDELEVEGYLAYPEFITDKIPLIIWNRGGNRKDGKIDDFLAKGMFGEIASWGYAVLASNYRKDDEFGGRDVNDIISLIDLSKEIPFCDETKIGMEGWSRGGMMTYKVLSKNSLIKCAVIISGLADLFRSEVNRSGLSKVYRQLFGTADENEFKLRKEDRSAVNFADRICKHTDILLIHGTDDDKVSVQDSIEMYEKLNSAGIHCELELIEKGDHYLKKNRQEVSELRRNWFDKYLKKD